VNTKDHKLPLQEEWIGPVAARLAPDITSGTNTQDLVAVLAKMKE